MESESSITGSFKSKKILHSSTKPTTSSDQTGKAPNQSLWSSKTPEKPAELPRHSRNRGAAMSIKDIREAAVKLRKSGANSSQGPDPLMSAAKQQIGSLPDESRVAKSKKTNTLKNLPEKYEMLDKFFSSLDSSIRLLRLKGSLSTFSNISPKIECLTDRRFSHNHLAQLKFILPEAIEIQKVLLHDERTSCMKPDLHVTLNADAIKDDGKLKSNVGNLFLRKIFRSRLFDFFKSHPQGDEIPEETLPEPFNRPKQVLDKNMIKSSNSSSLGEASINVFSGEQSLAASHSHLPQSFQRRFSQKHLAKQPMVTDQEQPIVPAKISALEISEQTLETSTSSAPSPIKPSSKSSTVDESPKLGASSLEVLKHEVSSSIAADIKRTPCKNTSTPAKQPSTPANLASAMAPKRCHMSPDGDSMGSPKLVRRPPRSRSLQFNTPVKVKKEIRGTTTVSVDDDILDILPENILQSIREKERKAIEESDPAISQAKWRQQMIAGLPKFFDRVHFLFQSLNHSVLTRDELLHKMMTSQLDIVDRREVEEKLRLLVELVPEWIYEKSALTGDTLVRINKISSTESIRAKLAEAK